MKKLALIAGLVIALLVLGCSQAPQQAAPPPANAPPTATAPPQPAAASAGQAAAGAATGSDATVNDLVGSPSQPEEPGDPSLLSNDTIPDATSTT